MRVTTLRSIGDALLVLAAVVAAYATWLHAVVGEWVGVAAMAPCAALPLVALAGWRRPQPIGGWGWMVPYGLAGLIFGYSAGGLLLYGLLPFGLGNLAWRWVVRAQARAG